MLALLQTDLAGLSAENILLLGIIGALIFLAIIRKMMRDSIKAQIASFDAFKLEIIMKIGETTAELSEIKKQYESSSRAYERRIEEIEHNQVRKEDFFRENTLIKSGYDDLNRFIHHVSSQLESLKYLLIEHHEHKLTNPTKND
jgi:Holliday junction resolvasome RuvABC DNA-binding subunit